MEARSCTLDAGFVTDTVRVLALRLRRVECLGAMRKVATQTWAYQHD